MVAEPPFTIVIRGYEIGVVGRLYAEVNRALATEEPDVRRATAELVKRAQLPVKFRGYDRRQVDEFLDDARQRLS
jgi:DivIVA domain-containing protein